MLSARNSLFLAAIVTAPVAPALSVLLLLVAVGL